MFHNFVEVSGHVLNFMGYSIAAIFGEVMGHYSQRKIIGLNQRLLKSN